MKKILLLICCSTFAFAGNSRTDKDVGVDTTFGLSYIVQKYDNPAGTIQVFGPEGKLVQAFSVSSSNRASWTEIELLHSNRMLVLQQNTGSWTVRKFERVNNEWNPSSSASEITGDGIAYKMQSVDINHVIVEHLPVGAAVSETLLIEDGSDLRVIKSIPTVALQTSLRAAAQETQSKREFGTPGGISFMAGLLSGLGIGYRRHFENKYGVQVGGIYWADQNTKFSDVGVELIRTLKKSEKVRFYGVAGSSIYTSVRKESDYSTCYPSPVAVPTERTPVPPSPSGVCVPVEGWRTSGTLNFGAGLGFEIHPSKNISFFFELPITVMLDLEKANRFHRTAILPVPSVGVTIYLN